MDQKGMIDRYVDILFDLLDLNDEEAERKYFSELCYAEQCFNESF